MKGKVLKITLWSVLIGSLTILGLLALRQQRSPTQPTRTPLIVTPTTVGCTGSISFRIEEDGSVISWCEEEVNK